MTKLVVSDADGCMLNGRKERINVNLVARAQKIIASLLFPLVYMTGRDPGAVQTFYNIFGNYGHDIPSICEAGSILLYGGVRFYHWIPNPRLDPNAIVALREIHGEITNLVYDLNAWFEPKQIVITIFCPDGQSQKLKIEQEVRKLTDGNEYLKVTTSDQTVEVLPGITKGDAVKYLAEDYRIDLEDILVIGDSGTDKLAMAIPEVMAACPANATDEIKNIVEGKGPGRGYVAEKPALEGWMEILERFL